MEDKIIILIVVLVVVAGVGGYFVGLYQGSGNFSLNVSNNTTGNISNGTVVPKTNTNTTPVKDITNKTNSSTNKTTNTP